MSEYLEEDITDRELGLSRARQMNNAVLSGADPADMRGSTDLDRYSRSRIIEDNIQCFEQIGFDKLTPYRRIAEGMDAMKHSKITIKIDKIVRVKKPNGDEYDKVIQVYQDIYSEGVDHQQRLRAVGQWAMLTGADPRKEASININQNGVQANIGDLYVEINNMTDAEALAHYNRLRQMEAQGKEIIMLPPQNQDQLVPHSDGSIQEGLVKRI